MDSAAKKIVVLDDSEIVLEMARGVLEEDGYAVTTLASPFSFCQVLQAEKPDLVLLDVDLPGLSGDKLIAVVRRNGLHRCPILLFSEQAPDALDALAERVGAQGAVAKSRGPAALLESVRRVLAS